MAAVVDHQGVVRQGAADRIGQRGGVHHRVGVGCGGGAHLLQVGGMLGVQPGQPVRVGLRRHRLQGCQQVVQRLAGIGMQRNLVQGRRAQGHRVDVDVDERLLAPHQRAVFVPQPRREAATHRQHHVGLGEGAVRGRACDQPAVADPVRAGAGHRAQDHLRGRDRRLQPCGQGLQRIDALRGDHAAAGDDQRAPRTGQLFGRLQQRLRVRPRCVQGAVTRWWHGQVVGRPVDRLGQHVLRDVQGHRAGPAAQRVAQGGAQQFGQAAHVVHHRAPLHQRGQHGQWGISAPPSDRLKTAQRAVLFAAAP